MVKNRISIVLLLSIILSSSVYGDDGKLHVVFTNWEPYGYIDNGKAAGFELDTFEAVMKKMNIDVVFLERPWKRCLFMAKTGEADVIISVLKTPERKKFLFYPTEPISRSNSAFFTTIDNDISFGGNYEDLKEYTIGVTRGFSYGPAFDSVKFLKKEDATTTEQVVQKLLKKRYDIAVGNTIVVSAIAKKIGVYSKIRFLTPLVHMQELYAGFSKAGKYGSLTSEFSKVLMEFKKTSANFEIMERYNFNVE